MQTNQSNPVIYKLLSDTLSNSVVQFFLDPVIPKLVTTYLTIYLNSWKKKGIIKNYEVNVQRLDKLYYKIGLQAYASKKETNITLLNYLSSNIEKILKQTTKK